MNKLILSGGILSLLTCLLHVFGGGPEIHQAALNSALNITLKAIFSVLWLDHSVVYSEWFGLYLGGKTAQTTNHTYSARFHPVYGL